jgi:hypothetical protein
VTKAIAIDASASSVASPRTVVPLTGSKATIQRARASVCTPRATRSKGAEERRVRSITNEVVLVDHGAREVRRFGDDQSVQFFLEEIGDAEIGAEMPYDRGEPVFPIDSSSIVHAAMHKHALQDPPRRSSKRSWPSSSETWDMTSSSPRKRETGVLQHAVDDLI